MESGAVTDARASMRVADVVSQHTSPIDSIGVSADAQQASLGSIGSPVRMQREVSNRGRAPVVPTASATTIASNLRTHANID
jgi:hypothetical protein